MTLQQDLDEADDRTLMERVATAETKIRMIEAALIKAFGYGWLRQIAENEKQDLDGTNI